MENYSAQLFEKGDVDLNILAKKYVSSILQWKKQALDYYVQWDPFM